MKTTRTFESGIGCEKVVLADHWPFEIVKYDQKIWFNDYGEEEKYTRTYLWYVFFVGETKPLKEKGYLYPEVAFKEALEEFEDRSKKSMERARKLLGSINNG